MQYRKDKNNNKISILGYGCMRFSKNSNGIDLDKAEKEIMTAIKNGVNYFDTAYIYPGSEVALGKILYKNKCRNKVNIATKLPQYLVKSTKALDKYFYEQLTRLQTNHIDYYLMHMITDIASWEKLKRLGIEKWIADKKSTGEIRNIGFSFHGNSEMFIKILNAYDWDFCQIQYNYMDEHSQAGKKGLDVAYEKNIPVIIMEPLRGGKLVNLLPPKAKEIIKNNKRKFSAAEWAFRWLWNQKEVTCVLSGMNSVEMVKENIKIASNVQINEFTEEDFQIIEDIKKEINKNIKVNCTGCGYCMPCPMGVDIPTTFRCYNEIYTEGKNVGRKEYFQTTGMRKDISDASMCVECGKCEKQCPQHIEIRKNLKIARKELQPFHLKVALKAIRIFKLW